MRALFVEGEPGMSPQEIDGLVAARLSRQEVLRRDNPPDSWWILNEGHQQRFMRDQVAEVGRAGGQPPDLLVIAGRAACRRPHRVFPPEFRSSCRVQSLAG
ncbi:hypothetical protein H8R17_37355 [Streptomyces sp. TRM68367]|nr:hypothetical protein [Streptomyces sp. TRM68367]